MIYEWQIRGTGTNHSGRDTNTDLQTQITLHLFVHCVLRVM